MFDWKGRLRLPLFSLYKNYFLYQPHSNYAYYAFFMLSLCLLYAYFFFLTI